MKTITDQQSVTVHVPVGAIVRFIAQKKESVAVVGVVAATAIVSHLCKVSIAAHFDSWVIDAMAAWIIFGRRK